MKDRRQNTEHRRQNIEPQVKKFKLSELQLAKYNPRIITDEALAGLGKSIKRFGCVEPIIVNIRGGKNIIVGGNQRFKVLLAAGTKEAVCITVDLNEEDEKLLNLTLNNPYIQGEFITKIGEYIDELRKGLTDQQDYLGLCIDKLRGEIEKQGRTGDDEIPEIPKKAKTKTGDLYQLEEHRLLCGDSIKEEDVKRIMNGQKADMVFTDPPYGVEYEGGSGNKTKRDKIIGDQNSELYYPSLKIAYDITIDKVAVYLWFAGFEIQAVIQAVIQANFKIRNLLIWNKLNAHYGCLNAQYKQRHEPFLYLHKKGKSPNWFGPNNECTVWDIEQANINEFHPTQKPVALAERAIKNSSKQKQIVLDLFLGSGSTLIACEKLNRRCYGMEIEPIYCDVIVERWEKWTRKKAKLLKR